ncbi:hypothetical protein L249_0467 [Ophiocordyceps polyrhachis-furcata BCC 54312]|uniref:Uncharacterized protein n=1 Tax=Ophiocordyceps polyrhachis-furcata BCC 54312 TaxID=1330021 RepID=A0A367LFH7_9HYPO|nr:hypothetical protein L249_0467 [Ophiocordyceps polyrhachis-furcata BCC 54312]
MDDPDRIWPAWKFGLRRDDLFTTLHDRYNTFNFTIQNPEAFYLDVSEIAHDADTADDFYRLLNLRRKQRLSELNESLKTVACEIVGNPRLMADEQWQHALQLFRAKSYDSIVRYFASYLPDNHDDFNDAQSTSSGSSSSDADSIHTLSTKASSSDQISSSLFLDDDYAHDPSEPCSLHHDDLCEDGPMSETSSCVSSVDSPNMSPMNPPSRSMSFSGSDSGHIHALMSTHFGHGDDDESCSLDDGASDSGLHHHSSTPHDAATVASHFQPQSHTPAPPQEDDGDEFPCTQFPEDQFDYVDTVQQVDVLESDTPTPRQDATSAAACSYVDYKSAVGRRRAPQRSPSPKVSCRRVYETLSKVQKPVSDPLRKRLRGMRRPD